MPKFKESEVIAALRAHGSSTTDCEDCPYYKTADCNKLYEYASELIESKLSTDEAYSEAMDKIDVLATELATLRATEITPDEAYSLAELIDMDLIDHIRNDTDVDSMRWLINIVHAFEKLCKKSGFQSLTADMGGDEE